MTPEEYTDRCLAVAAEADDKLRELHDLLAARGENARASGVDAARYSLSMSVEIDRFLASLPGARRNHG